MKYIPAIFKFSIFRFIQHKSSVIFFLGFSGSHICFVFTIFDFCLPISPVHDNEWPRNGGKPGLVSSKKEKKQENELTVIFLRVKDRANRKTWITNKYNEYYSSCYTSRDFSTIVIFWKNKMWSKMKKD